MSNVIPFPAMKVALTHRNIRGEEYDATYRPGDDFTWSNSANGNHGCEDSATFRLLPDGRWEVVDVTHCHSCWQVGHDNEHECAYRIGDIVDVPPTDVL